MSCLCVCVRWPVVSGHNGCQALCGRRGAGEAGRSLHTKSSRLSVINRAVCREGRLASTAGAERYCRGTAGARSQRPAGPLLLTHMLPSKSSKSAAPLDNDQQRTSQWGQR